MQFGCDDYSLLGKVQMIYFASLLIGSVIGLISAAIFAVILRRIETEKPSEAIRALIQLIGIVLGSGLGDFVVFDFILKSGGALQYYMIGLASLFLPLGILVFIDWKR